MRRADNRLESFVKSGARGTPRVCMRNKRNYFVSRRINSCGELTVNQLGRQCRSRMDEILFAGRKLLFPTGISHVAITGRITVVCSKYDERDETQTAASRGGVRYARSRSTNDDTSTCRD